MNVPFDILKKAIKEKKLHSCITRYNKNGDWAICHERVSRNIQGNKTYRYYTIVLCVTNGIQEEERFVTDFNGRESTERDISQLEPLADKYYNKLKKHYNL